MPTILSWEFSSSQLHLKFSHAGAYLSTLKYWCNLDHGKIPCDFSSHMSVWTFFSYPRTPALRIFLPRTPFTITARTPRLILVEGEGIPRVSMDTGKFS